MEGQLRSKEILRVTQHNWNSGQHSCHKPPESQWEAPEVPTRIWYMSLSHITGSCAVSLICRETLQHSLPSLLPLKLSNALSATQMPMCDSTIATQSLPTAVQLEFEQLINNPLVFYYYSFSRLMCRYFYPRKVKKSDVFPEKIFYL